MTLPSWPTLLNYLKNNIDPKEFQIWIEPLRLDESNESELMLVCPNAFHRKWVWEHYLPKLKKILSKLKINTEITLKVKEVYHTKSTLKYQKKTSSKINHFKPIFNRRFVFGNFVIGPNNEFASAATKALACGQQSFLNTLFLFSKTGLGKSHLTQAAGHYVMQSDPRQKVAYLTAEDFANKMISALHKKRIHEFKEKFRRTCDVLLLEEVQFLAGKDKTQDELSYTLDALLDSNKRIIFTGSDLPSRIKGLKESLASRMSSGLTASISSPDQSTRLNILQRILREEQINIDPEILEFLAQKLSGDIRHLQSALVGLIAKANFTGQIISLDLAKKIINQSTPQPSNITPDTILTLISKIYNIEKKIIISKNRTKKITHSRNLGMFLCRLYTNASYAKIGKLFNRDHSTVIYNINQIKKNLLKDKKTNHEISFLEQHLGILSNRKQN